LSCIKGSFTKNFRTSVLEKEPDYDGLLPGADTYESAEESKNLIPREKQAKTSDISGILQSVHELIDF
jgi:hypothetical protein